MSVFSTDEENFEELLQDSVAEICRHENFPRFLRWLQERLGVRRTTLFAPVAQPDVSSPAIKLAVAIWNMVPLPGQGFRITRVSLPKGKQPCLCGSERPFRQCCDRYPMPYELLDADPLWALVFDRLPAKKLKELLQGEQIPLAGRIQGAIAALEDDRPKKALSFLEPVFASAHFPDVGEDGAYALGLLVDSYDILGFYLKKIGVIEHVVAVAPSSALRSEAYQQQAMIRMDQGRNEEAWQSFRKAQIDFPDDFKVGLLEVQLLLMEGRYDRAAERARFVAKRMERRGVDAEFAVDFLKGVAENPRRGSLRMEFAAVEGVGSELVDILENVESRPVPGYRIVGMGEAAEVDARERSGAAYALVAPKALRKGEERWVHLPPPVLERPMALQGAVEDFPWQPDADYGWIRFLHKHPVSFDSLMILEGVLRLIDLHPNRMLPGFIEFVRNRVMNRALAVVRKACEQLPLGGRLPWMVHENRPLHRILQTHSLDLLLEGDLERFFAVAENMLQIDPLDNYGVRAMLINSYLRAGKAPQALAVCAGYPDDTLAEMMYGKALALFALGRTGEAGLAVTDAVRTLPLVAQYLLAKKVRAPRGYDAFGSPGSPWDASRYREDMRSVWKSTGEALAWLKTYVDSP